MVKHFSSCMRCNYCPKDVHGEHSSIEYTIQSDGTIVTYFINHDAGVVVATTKFYLDKRILSNNAISAKLVEMRDAGKLTIPTSVRGISRVQEGDEFDLKFGKRLAYKRMVSRIISKNLRYAQRAKDALREDLNEATKVVGKISQSYGSSGLSLLHLVHEKYPPTVEMGS